MLRICNKSLGTMYDITLKKESTWWVCSRNYFMCLFLSCDSLFRGVIPVVDRPP
jgi:hypothetical protein